MTESDPRSTKVTPQSGLDAFDCPLCGAFAHQKWWGLRGQSGSNLLPMDRDYIGARWTLAQCAHCKGVSVWREDQMVYPEGSVIPLAHVDMPESVRELYNEGRAVWSISPRAGAALARAAVETLLKALDPGPGTLEKRIERMLPNVSDGLGQMLTVVRHVGNKSVHPEEEPDDLLVVVLDPDQTEVGGLLFETVNDLVEERIARPARQGSLFDRVPEAVRARLPKRHPDS